MNWKLIFALSLFGLAMGTATVYVVGSNVEPLFWLGIFIVCAVIIARVAPGRYFLHGFLVSMVNSVWITASHVLMFEQYVASHQEELRMMSSAPLASNPRLQMLFVGPLFGAVFGIILGLFSLVAAKLLNRTSRAVS
jgi:hypothetical protein